MCSPHSADAPPGASADVVDGTACHAPNDSRATRGSLSPTMTRVPGRALTDADKAQDQAPEDGRRRLWCGDRHPNRLAGGRRGPLGRRTPPDCGTDHPAVAGGSACSGAVVQVGAARQVEHAGHVVVRSSPRWSGTAPARGAGAHPVRASSQDAIPPPTPAVPEAARHSRRVPAMSPCGHGRCRTAPAAVGRNNAYSLVVPAILGAASRARRTTAPRACRIWL